MNLEKIFKMQKSLDQAIAKEHNIVAEKVKEKRILALLVELGEFANEISNFKYWKKNKTLNHEKILEEFVDGIHFYCSLILTLNGKQVIHSNIVNDNLDIQFLEVYGSLADLYKNFNEENLEKSFALYLGIARLLKFSNEEIEKFYISKNKKNYQRIADNY